MPFFSWLRGYDSYGVPINLHFGKWVTKEKGRSSTFGTEVGGFLSIIGNVCLVYSLYVYANAMINK
jgi:hypothetical protein